VIFDQIDKVVWPAIRNYSLEERGLSFAIRRHDDDVETSRQRVVRAACQAIEKLVDLANRLARVEARILVTSLYSLRLAGPLDGGDGFGHRSHAWRAARYRFMAGLSKPLKCCACGASAREVRLACDHVIPIKTEEGWRKRLTGPFQMLCAGSEGCAANLAKGSHDFTYFGENEGNKQIETS
jgi:hypothetical protein